MRLAIFVGVALLLIAPAAEASWTTSGGNAHRTSLSDDLHTEMAGATNWSISSPSLMGGVSVTPDHVVAAGTNVHVFRRDDGGMVWQSSATNESFRTQPAIASGVVVASGVQGGPEARDLIVAAFDLATGHRQWQVNRTLVGQLDMTLGDPIIVDGLVVAALGPDLLAISLGTGETLWSLRSSAMWGSPTAHGATIYVGQDDGSISAISLEGSVRWNATLPARVIAAPLVTEGRVFVVAQTGLFAFDAATGDKAWAANFAFPTIAPPTLVHDTVVVTSGSDVLAFAATDGKLRWKATAGGSIHGPAAMAQQRLIVFSLDHTAEFFEPLTGKKLGERELPIRFILSAPAVAADHIFVLGWPVGASERGNTLAAIPATPVAPKDAIPLPSLLPILVLVALATSRIRPSKR